MGTRYVSDNIAAEAVGAAGIELSPVATELTDVVVLDGMITSSYAEGIRGLGSDHDVMHRGWIIADTDGVRLGDNRAVDHDQRVWIYSGAEIDAVNGAGVSVTAYSSLVYNDGDIEGHRYGILMSGVSKATKSTIENKGDILATDYGIAHSLAGGDTEGLVVKNTGSIEGKQFSFYGGDNNVAADRIVNKGTMIGDIALGGGNDVYEGRDGKTVESIVYGGIGDDRLYGSRDEDTFHGGDGNDYLDGGAGSDLLVGGTGDDTYVISIPVYENRTDPVTGEVILAFYGDTLVEGRNGGIDTIRSNMNGDLGTFDNIENFVLTVIARGVSSSIAGNALANSLTGNDDANVIDGRAGADVMIGLGGNDSYTVDSTGDKVVEATNGGTDLVTSAVTFSLAGLQIEKLTLAGIDNINATGNSLDNYIVGNAGNNIINGGAGSDTIILSGSVTDSDTIVFSTLPTATNIDSILGFQSLAGAAGDVIHLDGDVFNTLPKGQVSASTFQIGSSTTAATADIRLIYSTSTRTLYYDKDGSGAESAVVISSFSGASPLLTDDVFVI
ncbi:calcium-binding protein [Methylobacterium sp. 88A]|uniref:calcium-binding protein n=1 Tax=Methylobacterium sp. 88A TaxID=1131813 RepID=UPI00036728DC|nr:calcium-binding protein [Methylobacterium sp. 88A]